MSDGGRTSPATAGGGLAEASFVPRPDTAGRLRDALGLLGAVEHGELFAAAPPTADDRRRHEAGVAVLRVLTRDLERLLAEVRAYEDVAAASAPRFPSADRRVTGG